MLCVSLTIIRVFLAAQLLFSAFVQLLKLFVWKEMKLFGHPVCFLSSFGVVDRTAL